MCGIFNLFFSVFTPNFYLLIFWFFYCSFQIFLLLTRIYFLFRCFIHFTFICLANKLQHIWISINYIFLLLYYFVLNFIIILFKKFIIKVSILCLYLNTCHLCFYTFINLYQCFPFWINNKNIYTFVFYALKNLTQFF